MAIVFGFGMSHAPPVHQHLKEMSRWLKRQIDKKQSSGWIIPSATWDLTPEVMDEYWLRTRRSFEALRSGLAGANPEVLIIFGGTGGNQFPTDQPAVATVFAGEEAYGLLSGDSSPVLETVGGEELYVHLKTDVELANKIATGLADRGFDIQKSTEFRTNGPALLQDDWANPTEVFHRKDLPVVIVGMNYGGQGQNRDGSMHVSGDLAYNLGRAVAEIVADEQKRIAICGSGGLSHDPNGPRNMWIDTVLDEWVLDRIRSREAGHLRNLFEFDSMTIRAGTREIAAWIAAAAAMETIESDPVVLDYIGDAPQFQGGIGYAYWQPATSQV